MKFFIAASLAASSTSTVEGSIHKRSFLATEAETSFKSHQLKNDGDKAKKEFEEEKKKMYEQLQGAGAMEMLTASSVETEKTKFAKDYSLVREKAEHKRKHMTHEDALNMLSTKLTSEQKSEMTLLLKKDGEHMVLKADDKAMFVKAMASLNDMFLSIDDSRIRTLTDCTVDLGYMFRQMFFYWDTIRELEASTGEAFAAAFTAYTNAESTQGKIDKENDKMEELKGKQKIAMDAEEKVLEGMEADVALYRFIMAQINKKCASETKLLQVQTKRTEKQERCANTVSVNRAVLEIFADPGVVAQAEKDLDWHGNHSLKQTLANIHQAEMEEHHPKYAFLQAAPSGGAGGVCGSSDGLDCSALMTIVGQELECNKQKVREQEGIIKALEEKQKEERDDISTQIGVYEKTKENFQTITLNYLGEAKGYGQPRMKNMQMLMEYFERTKERRFECYLKLFELENNYYCAVKHLREYMKGLTLTAWGLDEEDVMDCQAEEFMMPEAMCYYKDDPTKHVPCIEGDKLPVSEELMPVQQWTRTQIQPALHSDKARGLLGNSTIALACPHTMTMMQVCNNYLCPLDCQVTEWSPWSACTAECGGGSEQRSRTVVAVQRSGGEKCPPTQESQQCNTQSCDVDCVLHEDWVPDTGCLQACGPAGSRFELLKKHIKVEAIGNGECPAKHAMDERVMFNACDDRLCTGDELCDDVMDLVIAYECSATVTRLGCWFMASFVVALLERMPTAVWGLPTIEVALVKFGNGKSLPEKDEEGKIVPDRYYVNPAKMLSDLTQDVVGLTPKLYADVIGLWSGTSNYHLGFNNIGSAMKVSAEILDKADRVEGEITASKKVLVLTKGKRAGCTVVKSVAEGMKTKGVIIDMILFSATYAANPAEYEILQEAVSFPFKAHLHSVAGLAKLNDYGFRQSTAQQFIPSICPDAYSPKVIEKKQCEKKFAIVHRGRTCHNWTKELSDKPVDVVTCRDLAEAAGYIGFIHTESTGQEPNCFTHEELGKVPQVNDAGLPLETTCDYVPDYGKGKEAEFKGWLKQTLAAGNGEKTSHYRVLASAAECGGISNQIVAQYAWKPETYFIPK